MNNAGKTTSEVAYLGVPGSFSHMAASQYFGGSNLKGFESFKEVFDSLMDGKSTYGIVPIENTLAGSIYENFDLLDQDKPKIIGECYLRIEHFLLSIPSQTSVKNIKKVLSHQKALEQCKNFFEKHPWIKQEAVSDTARAAQFVSEQQDSSLAAIAGPQAAQLYKLKTLLSNIEDDNKNYTRFIVLTYGDAMVEGADKYSFEFELLHQPGSLYTLLGILTKHHCNVTEIESRPFIHRPFEYKFYIDATFDPKSCDTEKLAAELKRSTAAMTILGMYKSSANTVRH